VNATQTEKWVKAALYGTVGLSVLFLPVVLIWVAANGLGAVNWGFITGVPTKLEYGGILPQIAGSLLLVALSTLLSAPLGVASAIYLSEYAPDNHLTRAVRFFTETLAGMPSIVVGLFGLQLLVYQLQLKTSLISGAICLSFLMLPWTIRASEEAIKTVPRDYREASLALGATKWETILRVVVPSAAPGIITGVLLGMGKAIGETTIPWLTTGSGLETYLPSSLSSPAGSLPLYIYMLVTQGHTAAGSQHAFGASLVLLLLFLAMSASALLLRNHFLRKLGGQS